MKRESIIKVICYLFVLLFVYAGASKLLDYERFAMQIGQSPVLHSYANLVVWVVPVVELIISGLLIIKGTRLLGLYLATGLMFLFTVYILVILYFSPYVPCSCGGVLEGMGWGSHLVFNIIFFIAGIVGLVLYTKSEHLISRVVSD